MSSPSRPDDRTSTDDEFEALLMEHLEPAYRLALRLTGSSEDAEDLVQEAALRAFRFRSTFQKGTKFMSWFYRIVVNQFYTTTRRRRNTRTTSLNSLTDATDLSRFARSAEAQRHVVQRNRRDIGGTDRHGALTAPSRPSHAASSSGEWPRS